MLPKISERVEHEGELAVVIGRRARRIGEDVDPLSYVLGYTCLNDVTARDLQRKDVQFTRGKSFDTFCPVGPFVVGGLNPLDLYVETRVNGEVRQKARTSALAFSVPFLLRYISNILTLEPGDLSHRDARRGRPSPTGRCRRGRSRRRRHASEQCPRGDLKSTTPEFRLNLEKDSDMRLRREQI